MEKDKKPDPIVSETDQHPNPVGEEAAAETSSSVDNVVAPGHPGGGNGQRPTEEKTWRGTVTTPTRVTGSSWPPSTNNRVNIWN